MKKIQAKQAVEMALKDEKQLMVSFAMLVLKMDLVYYYCDPREPFF